MISGVLLRIVCWISLVATFVASTGVGVMNLILPEHMAWVSEARLEKLLILSGISGAVLFSAIFLAGARRGINQDRFMYD